MLSYLSCLRSSLEKSLFVYIKWQGTLKVILSILLVSFLVRILPYRHKQFFCLVLKSGKLLNFMPCNKLLVNPAYLILTGEYWPLVIIVWTSLHSVHTIQTSGQYSQEEPSCSVGKRLIFLLCITFFCLSKIELIVGFVFFTLTVHFPFSVKERCDKFKCR